MSWLPFEAGRTIGTLGSESGIILLDEEHLNGARLTLEKSSVNAPYAITIGIYGLLFHTIFFSDLEKSEVRFNLLKQNIEPILTHLSVEEIDRKDGWRSQLNEMTDDLIA